MLMVGWLVGWDVVPDVLIGSVVGLELRRAMVVLCSKVMGVMKKNIC